MRLVGSFDAVKRLWERGAVSCALPLASSQIAGQGDYSAARITVCDKVLSYAQGF